MKCPLCGRSNDKVIDSRSSKDLKSIRRRRECLSCNHRFTTYEYLEQNSRFVIKKSLKREPFSKDKIKNGILVACKKRDIDVETVDKIVNSIEKGLIRRNRGEIKTQEVGEIVMEKLVKLDQIAYIRFASVYLEFKTSEDFLTQLQAKLGEQNE